MKKLCKICNNELDISNFRKIGSRMSVRKNAVIEYFRGECKNCESLNSGKRHQIEFTKNPNMFKTDEYKEKVKKMRRRRYFYYKALKFKNHYNCNLNTKELALFFWHKYHHQKGLCAISGRKLSDKNMEIDHIIPRTPEIIINDYSNLRLVTREANKLKSNMTEDVFKQLIIDVYNFSICNMSKNNE